MDLTTVINRLTDPRILVLGSIYLFMKWLLTAFPAMVATPIWMLPGIGTVAILASVCFDPQHKGTA